MNKVAYYKEEIYKQAEGIRDDIQRYRDKRDYIKMNSSNIATPLGVSGGLIGSSYANVKKLSPKAGRNLAITGALGLGYLGKKFDDTISGLRFDELYDE